ncbi:MULTISPECIES: DsbE family thiol:disulfide interchange protein [Marinomonas]|uniref:Periplasmic protein thiol:disulfide oxidoreductases, DsbE subfamily n=1 Tax=Marinomonas fungiae TaxID=1137284 RepID=A0A0K6IUI5_9GAMM|nr:MULTISPECIES: DsbE family thiol:disulfide interchange protein [Marinomonas]CUB06729.1 periplasmic protein thiol:disulfide oxidoreductases, DsbE subfamily [Marinomonas fungiae]
MRRVLLFLPLAVVIGLGFFLWRGLYLNPKELPSALIGKPVPQFELPWLEKPGQTLTQEALKGKVSLLNIWATWCPSCRTEHPFLMELAHRRGIPIYGVDYKDEVPAANRWLSDLGNPYVANVVDDKGSLGLDLGVYGAPETFIIDKRGVIRYRHAGPLNDAIWKRDLLPVFQQLQGE